MFFNFGSLEYYGILATSTELGNVVAAVPKDWSSVLFMFLMHVFCVPFFAGFNSHCLVCMFERFYVPNWLCLKIPFPTGGLRVTWLF